MYSSEGYAETAGTAPDSGSVFQRTPDPERMNDEAGAGEGGLRAPVNRIIPFSSVDGPGNRTAVFLQGCDWDCRYCHNPETRKLCMGCGECVPACPAHALSFRPSGETGAFPGSVTGSYAGVTPLQSGQTDACEGGSGGSRIVYDPSACVWCDTCITVCRHDASPRIRMLTPGETFALVRRQIPYIRGVTASGGECSLYTGYLEELFALCHRAGLNTLMDSNGSIPLWDKRRLLAVTDGVMLDIKAFDAALHRRVTGADNRTVLENARFLAEEGKLEEIRTVVVPELFDAKETILGAAELLKDTGVLNKVRYRLITYRENGVRKQYRDCRPPTPEEMDELRRTAAEAGFCGAVVT